MEEEAKLPQRWSRNTKIATLVVFSILGAFTVVLGSLYYRPPSPPNSDWICPGFGLGPCYPRETLNMVSSQTNSPTNMTLQLKNTSSVSITICAYYVKNTTGQQYSNNSSSCWPAMAIGALASFNVPIDGKAFTFKTGSSYIVTLVTSRNAAISFSVVA